MIGVMRPKEESPICQPEKVGWSRSVRLGPVRPAIRSGASKRSGDFRARQEPYRSGMHLSAWEAPPGQPGPWRRWRTPGFSRCIPAANETASRAP